MKKLVTATVGSVALLISGAALAQQPGGYGWSGSYSPTAPPSRSSSVDNIGEEGQLVFGVDRVMGVAFDRAQTEVSAGGQTVTSTDKNTTIALFGMGGPSGGGSPGAGASALLPRLALDYFVVESISVGGSLVYISRSGEVETDAGSADTGTTSTFMVHPRLGYALVFDETFGLWPRAGVTYYNTKTVIPPATGGGADAEYKWNGFEITAEVPVIISPFEHFAILIGPYLEFPLSGTSEVPATAPATGTEEYDTKLTSFGLTTSIVGYF